MSELFSSALWPDLSYAPFSESGALGTEGLFETWDAQADWAIPLRQVNDLRTLHDDWDGEGASAPKPEVIAVAVGLFRGLMKHDVLPPSRVAPSPTGGIIVEWRHGTDYLEAEIDSVDVVEWMSIREGEPARHWDQELASVSGQSATTAAIDRAPSLEAIAWETSSLSPHGNG